MINEKMQCCRLLIRMMNYDLVLYVRPKDFSGLIVQKQLKLVGESSKFLDIKLRIPQYAKLTA
jgi:hypothetical protein